MVARTSKKRRNEPKGAIPSPNAYGLPSIDVEFAEALQPLFQPSQFKTLAGGRGGMKSWGVSQLYIMRARTESALFLCARELQNSISDSVYALLKNTAYRIGIQNEFKFYRNEIVHAVTESKFIFKGIRYNTEEIKSTEGVKYCWIEEAAKLTQNSIEVLFPTIRADDSEIICTYNPDLVTDPIHQMFFVNTPPPDSIVIHLTYKDNPWFPESLRKQMEWLRETDYETYLWVWEGQARAQNEFTIYKNVLFDPFDSPQPGEAINGQVVQFKYGMDWGFGSDPCAGVRCFVMDDELYIDHEWFGFEYDYDERLVRECREALPGAESNTSFGDNQRPEAIRHFNRNGFLMRPCTKYKGSVEDGIGFVRGFKKIHVHPRCVNVEREIKSYKYKVKKKGAPDDPVEYVEPEDKNNHCMDSIRYAFDEEINGLGEVNVSDEFLERYQAARHSNLGGRPLNNTAALGARVRFVGRKR